MQIRKLTSETTSANFSSPYLYVLCILAVTYASSCVMCTKRESETGVVRGGVIKNVRIRITLLIKLKITQIIARLQLWRGRAHRQVHPAGEEHDDRVQRVGRGVRLTGGRLRPRSQCWPVLVAHRRAVQQPAAWRPRARRRVVGATRDEVGECGQRRHLEVVSRQ